MRITRLLRVLLVVFAAGLAVGVLMVHWLSLDVAQTYPEVAHLRAPAFWAAVVEAVDNRRFDVLILDGEATPMGGMGLCRQLKNEIFQCPPTLVLTGRVQDGWLAAWSQADAVVPHPLDPVALARAVTQLAGAGAGATAAH